LGGWTGLSWLSKRPNAGFYDAQSNSLQVNSSFRATVTFLKEDYIAHNQLVMSQ